MITRRASLSNRYHLRHLIGTTLLGALLASPTGWAVSPGNLFQTSDRCLACHNSLTSPSGENISIGSDWRSSMMANSARDPYWQAGVRREVMDHPKAAAAIQHECATCHMPMARYVTAEAGGLQPVFAHLGFRPGDPMDQLAADGVSCTVCHQITPENFGKRESFVGRFRITPAGSGPRPVYGPFDVDPGRQRIMSSSTGGFQPVRGDHIRRSELCATCHTLFTHTLDEEGKPAGEFPEQVPYLEWLHSSYRERQSCQDCHMPRLEGPVRISSVLGQPRDSLARHTFRGANFFMRLVLNLYRGELKVVATPEELQGAVERTRAFLAQESARLSLPIARREGGELRVVVRVENLAGHKLPTAYPSRRVWIHLLVRDSSGNPIFESGAFRPDGSIQGNDNDLDPGRYEPHYTVITEPDQVMIYEPVLGDLQGRPTTGLLSAARYLKDNRLLPAGFEKSSAPPEIAVAGRAQDDPDFTGGSDQVEYRIRAGRNPGPFEVIAELWYQPISYRWAHNLARYDAMETQRWVRYYQSLSGVSATRLAHTSARID